MLILRTQSDISGYELPFVNEVEINSSWDNLTDTATFVMPKNVNFKRDGVELFEFAKGANAIFKRGDSVDLLAGYDGGIDMVGLTSRFKGYISRIIPALPVDMTFEDDMYLFKQAKVGKYSEAEITLGKALSDIIPDNITVVNQDINIGFLRIEDPNTTIAGVLKHLKDKRGITSYFRNGVLYSGFAYITEHPGGAPITHVFDARKNIIDADSLEYKNADDSLVNLTVISIYPNNTKIEVKAGDENGDKRTIYVYDVPESDLQDRADQELLKFQYDGFRGSFETFLEPQVRHGDAVQLIDDRISDRNDVYLVKGVTTRYGMGGGRQIIELDRRVE